MWLGGGNGAVTTFVRYFSRKRAPNLRKINPKVPQQEAAVIAESLYHIIKQNGPLSVSNTWNHAKVKCPSKQILELLLCLECCLFESYCCLLVV